MVCTIEFLVLVLVQDRNKWSCKLTTHVPASITGDHHTEILKAPCFLLTHVTYVVTLAMLDVV